jgi:hypothetical protein
MKLTLEQAEAVMYGPHVADYYGAGHRWWTERFYVFQVDDQLWEFMYEEPATEMQENDQEEFDCYEVRAEPHTTYRYVRVQ